MKILTDQQIALVSNYCVKLNVADTVAARNNFMSLLFQELSLYSELHNRLTYTVVRKLNHLS